MAGEQSRGGCCPTGKVKEGLKDEKFSQGHTGVEFIFLDMLLNVQDCALCLFCGSFTHAVNDLPDLKGRGQLSGQRLVTVISWTQYPIWSCLVQKGRTQQERLKGK